MRVAISEDKVVERIQTEKPRAYTSIPSPQVMRECSMSPSRVSTSLHGVLRGHSTLLESAMKTQPMESVVS